MGTQSLRLKVGSIYTKGPGKIYYFRYQVEGHRKTVSLQTTSRAEALKKAQTGLLRRKNLWAEKTCGKWYNVNSCSLWTGLEQRQKKFAAGTAGCARYPQRNSGGEVL